MDEAEQRLFTLANTAALVLFNQNGNPPRLSLSQRSVAEQGVSLLKAYKETVVAPAMEAVGKDIGATLAARGFTLVPIEPTPEMRSAFHKAQAEHERGIGYGPDHQWEAMLAVAPKLSI